MCELSMHLSSLYVPGVQTRTSYISTAVVLYDEIHRAAQGNHAKGKPMVGMLSERSVHNDRQLGIGTHLPVVHIVTEIFISHSELHASSAVTWFWSPQGSFQHMKEQL